MTKHADDEPVMFGYSSGHNITFNNKDGRDESGYTWGEWRKMSDKDREDTLQEYLNELVDVFVQDDEN